MAKKHTKTVSNCEKNSVKKKAKELLFMLFRTDMIHWFIDSWMTAKIAIAFFRLLYTSNVIMSKTDK